MNKQWLEFLRLRGANISDSGVADFGDPVSERKAVMHGSIMTDLSHLGLIRISGDDAANFLQNQLSNDVRRVDAGHSQLNSYCSPKGRMLTVFRLFMMNGDYYLRAPAGLIDAIIKRLGIFVLMSKVKLEDASDELLRMGVAGPGTSALLAEHFKDIPTDTASAVEACGAKVLQVPGNERFEIYAPPVTLQSLWERFETTLAPVGIDAWPLLDILNGIPNVYPETSEHFIPQMANLQLIDGVSFKKGCYPGQEVVARMQYLGKLKRSMYRVQSSGNYIPQPGTEVVSNSDGKTHEAGEIVDARALPDGGYTALAVLQTASIDQTLELKDQPGSALQLADLPYSLS
ncbi:MAG TPA: folate-binding protein YgfZ [Gammaproteobacteria bacterium]|jgi:folate-binding protein YgfZ